MVANTPRGRAVNFLAFGDQAYESMSASSATGGIGSLMNSQTFEIARYRFRATFARRFGTYLSVILLIGLTGGVAMASIAAARRTQSSYPTFSEEHESVDAHHGRLRSSRRCGKGSASLISKIDRLRDVATVRSLASGGRR